MQRDNALVDVYLRTYVCGVRPYNYVGRYSTIVNVLGCIVGEMVLGKALFPGTSTINQIERIMQHIERPSKADVDAIGSQYAHSVSHFCSARTYGLVLGGWLVGTEPKRQFAREKRLGLYLSGSG